MRHQVLSFVRIVVPIMILGAIALAGQAGQRWMP
jgi:hypothetical protein